MSLNRFLTVTPEKAEALNLFFCFRWVLIAFKCEFPFEDVLRLWEILWTDYYSSQFLLFVAFAVLESHRDMILRYLIEVGERRSRLRLVANLENNPFL